MCAGKLTQTEIEALKSISADYDKHGVEWKEAMFVLEALPRLLSLLTPPTDAAVPGSEDVAEALAEISAAGLGGVAEGMRLHLSDLTRRLAEVEEAYQHVKQCLHTSQERARQAEERIQELEDMQND